MKKIKKMGIIAWMTGILGTVAFAADVAPLQFEGVTTAEQQNYWESLMKYKLWGTGDGVDYGIILGGQGISLPDKSGYTGSAKAGMLFGNTKHVLGGPILLGGKIQTSDGYDTLSTGPVRLLGNFNAGNNSSSHNVFRGFHCIEGIANSAAKSGIDSDSLYENAEYSNCPASVPSVNTELTVPGLDYSGSYSSAIYKDKSTDTVFIDVAPDAESTGLPYDLYIESISLSNGAQLVVRMPSGGRLTRIFLKGSLSVASKTSIQVAYVDAGATWSGASWKNILTQTIVENKDYAGNLLVYTVKDIAWPAFDGTERVQGTYISTGVISLQQQMRFAGQLIANQVSLNANFDASSFLYVPFDPEIIDPTASASGDFQETDENQPLKITLKNAASINVSYDYCFDIPTASAVADSSGHDANLNDFNLNKTDLPICGTATRSGSIPSGSLEGVLYVNVKKDGKTEGFEYFTLNLFNLSGAVFSNNMHSASVSFRIKDADANRPPKIDPVKVNSVPENTKDFLVATIFVSDTNADNSVDTKFTYAVKSDADSEHFSIDENGIITTLDSLDYEADSIYKLTITVTDDHGSYSKSSDTTITVLVTDENESPFIVDTTFTVFEDVASQSEIGTPRSGDPDKYNTNGFKDLVFSLDGISEFFDVDGKTGKIVLKADKTLDYEKDSVYTLKVVVRDLSGNAGYLDSFATITIKVEDANDAPSFAGADTDFTVNENVSDASFVIGTVIATDEDGEVEGNPDYSTLTYKAIGGDDSFYAVSADGAITPKTPRDFESDSLDTLKIQVADGGGLFDTALVVIHIQDVNEAPTLADDSVFVQENAPVNTILKELVGSDPDVYNADFRGLSYALIAGDGTLYAVSDMNFGADPEHGKITLKRTFDFESDSLDTLKIQVADKGGLLDTATIVIHIADANDAPVIGKDQKFTTKEDIASGTLVGTILATDEDAKAEFSQYVFEAIGGDTEIYAVSSDGEITLKTGKTLDFETDEKDSLLLRVKDPSRSDLFDTATVFILIQDVNEAPALASVETNVPEYPTTIAGTKIWTLVGSDPDTKNSSFSTLSYGKLDGYDAASYDVAKNGEITVKVNLNYEADANHVDTLRVYVSDGFNRDTAFVIIHILDVEEIPVAAEATFSIPENSAGGTLVDTFTATDPDGKGLTYSITDKSGHFTIDPATGEITLKDGALLDYEGEVKNDDDAKMHYDVGNYYLVSVTSTGKESGLAATATVKIYVTDVNEAPTLADDVFSVPEDAEGGYSLGSVSSLDPDVVPKFCNNVYEAIGGDTAKYAVDAVGNITLKAGVSLDYETDSTDELKIHVRDASDATLSDVRTYAIKIADANDAPTLSPFVFHVDENKAGAIVGTVLGADADAGDVLTYSITEDANGKFMVDPATGKISLVDGVSLDYETVSRYPLIVTVTDKMGATASATVTILVDDVNEAPALDPARFDIAEDAGSEDAIGTVVGMDVDGDILTYLLYEDASGKFEISASGEISLKTGAFLDYETENVYEIVVKTMDPGKLWDTATVTISVTDANDAPAFAADTVFTEIPENAKAGYLVAALDTVTVDPDAASNNLRNVYAALDAFDFKKYTVSSSGEITLNAGVVLDFETDPSDTLKVLVRDVDDASLADTAVVIIQITDVAENPTLADTTLKVSENADGGDTVGTVAGFDPDGDVLTYEIKRDTSGKFTIDPATGEISLKNGETLDYETDSVYTLSVAVRNEDGNSDAATITVKVTNEIENVKIIYAASGDYSWKNPETIYTNRDTVYIKWTQDGDVRDSTVILDTDGKNTIVVRYQDGSDTLIVYRNTKSPVIEISADSDPVGPPSGVTIVEQKTASDTSSYVRSESATVTLVVTDSSGLKATTDTLSVTLTLDTAKVSSSDIKKAEATIGEVTLADESDLSSNVKVTHTILGSGTIAVSYRDTTAAGTAVTVTYYTDSDGKRLLNSNGDDYYEVSYAYTEATGKEVTLAYTVDALGTVVSDADGNTLYTVSYAVSDDTLQGTLAVSYEMDSEGNETRDADGNLLYRVSYAYADVYGNMATARTTVIVDRILPIVEILTPEDESTTSSVLVSVAWTVNGIEQDSLLTQGLNDGVNLIVRTYRDKAGNEGSDTVYIVLKSGKRITLDVEQNVVIPDADELEKFTSASTNSDGALYAVSALNAQTGLEEELLVGTSEGEKRGSGEEPYTGLSGKHLGQALVVTAQVPSVDETGTSSTLESIVENGYVSLDSGGGWDRELIPVAEYVKDYCSEDFQNDYDSLGGAASLYANTISMKVWLFTSLGAYVEDYGFSQELGTEYVDGSGRISLFLELKPNEAGLLTDNSGRLLGTGVFIFNTDVKMVSELRCRLPDHELGYKRTVKEKILENWGYKRPNT